jgi:hypothetical protein
VRLELPHPPTSATLKANRMRFIVEDERASPASLCDANG